MSQNQHKGREIKTIYCLKLVPPNQGYWYKHPHFHQIGSENMLDTNNCKRLWIIGQPQSSMRCSDVTSSKEYNNTQCVFRISTQNLNVSQASIPSELSNTCDHTTNAILLTTHLWILYYTFNTLNDLEWKVVNYKVIYLIEYYNFDVEFVSIRHCQPSQIW
jgi:hypothetical protein